MEIALYLKEKVRAMLRQGRNDILIEVNKISSEESRRLRENSTDFRRGDIIDRSMPLNAKLSLAEHYCLVIRQYDEALARLERDEYGICEKCYDNIPLGRLKQVPFTKYCLKCQTSIELKEKQLRYIPPIHLPFSFEKEKRRAMI